MDFGDSGSGTAKASVVAVGGCEYTKNGDIDEDIGDGGGGDFVNALADFAVRNTSGGGDDDEEEEEDDDEGVADLSASQNACIHMYGIFVCECMESDQRL